MDLQNPTKLVENFIEEKFIGNINALQWFVKPEPR